MGVGQVLERMSVIDGGVTVGHFHMPPLEGWRHVKVTDRHTAIDYAHALKDLSDTHFSGAAKIVLVLKIILHQHDLRGAGKNGCRTSP